MPVINCIRCGDEFESVWREPAAGSVMELLIAEHGHLTNGTVISGLCPSCEEEIAKLTPWLEPEPDPHA